MCIMKQLRLLTSFGPEITDFLTRVYRSKTSGKHIGRMHELPVASDSEVHPHPKKEQLSYALKIRLNLMEIYYIFFTRKYFLDFM